MLAALLSRDALESLAGGTVFRRGEAYFAQGAVGQLGVRDRAVTATVAGTRHYQVELRDEDGELAGKCTCPQGDDGYFCKHCVAVGLAWLSAQTPASPSSHTVGRKKVKAARDDPWKIIRRHLETQPRQALVDVVLDAAERDEWLFKSLLLKAELAQATGHPEKTFRRAIGDAIRVRGFLNWRETGPYAVRLHQLVDTLTELLRPESAGPLVELAEHAIEQLEKALERIDDSNGQVGDVAYRLGELHFRACALVRPDPVALAERLFRLETTLPFGACSFAPSTYAAVLGKRGLARYRELAEADWRKVQPRKRNTTDYDPHRTAITRIMEQLAEASGDVDELIAIKSGDLSSGASYLDIAEILTQAKRSDEALAWAERGWKACAERPHTGLRDFLIAAYLERGRNDEALQLAWAQYEDYPALQTYQRLHAVADRLGVWPMQRERALTWLAQATVKKAASAGRWGARASTPDHSVRLSIALWEKDLDAAWHTVQQGSCERALLLELAEMLERARAQDAVSLYRRVIPAIVGETSNVAYEQGVRLVRRVEGLMKEQGGLREFGAYLDELRMQFKAKRNFIKLLDGVDRDGKGR